MGLVLSSSEDFNFGRYQINDADVTRQNLKEYVKQNEKKLIYELLGIELGDLNSTITWLSNEENQSARMVIKSRIEMAKK